MEYDFDEVHHGSERRKRKFGPLVADDLEKGMTIAVLSYNPEVQQGPIRPGVPCKVLSVELPFVAVLPLVGQGVPILPIDTREVELMGCSEEYKLAFLEGDRPQRKAVKPKPKPEEKKVEKAPETKSAVDDAPDWAT